MKKLKLFISLWFTMFSVAVFAQAEFEKIAITQNTLDNSAGRLIVQDATTGELKYILKSVLDNKFNQPTGNATQYLDGAGTPTAFPVLGQADRVITEVRNTTGATVVKGTVVYLSGASGGKATIQKAQANSELTSSGTFGVIQSDINNNSNGYAVVIGTVLGVNTSSYTEGQVLWLSPTVAGGFTSTKPVAPNHAVYVAIVTLAATNGTIEVKVQNGYEIDELHDVLITSKANNDAIVYDSASGLWKNKQLVADAITDGTTTVAPSQNAVFDALAAKENTSSKNVANGYAGLGSDGKLFSTQLPSITITDTFVVGSQAAMLALTAETGDVAVRTDVNKSFILKGSDPAVLANWQELLTPTSAVTSVFGRNGAVTAQNGDYTTALVTETTNKRYQTDIQQAYNDATSSIQSQLNSKANDNTVVHLAGSESITGAKTFTATPSFDSNIYLKHLSSWSSPAGYTVIGGRTDGFLLSAGATKSALIGLGNLTQAWTYDFPNKSGTFAMTSDVPTISGTTNYVSKFTGASTLGNSQIFDNGTNVGIGTATPSYKLEVSGTTDGVIGIRNTTNNSFRGLSFLDGSGATEYSYIKYNANTGEMRYWANPTGFGGYTTFYSNASESMRITANGNIGIGTVSPSSKLHVVGKGIFDIGANSGDVLVLDKTSGGNVSFNINGVYSGQIGAVGSGDLYIASKSTYPAIVVKDGGNVGIGTTSPTAKLNVSGDIHIGDYGSSATRKLEFRTSTNLLGITTFPTNSDGSLIQYSWANGGQGPLKFGNASSVVLNLTAEGNVLIPTLGTGLVYSNGGTLTSTNPSDRRLKHSIMDLQYGLNEVLKLRPVTYNWKNDAIKQGKQFGFIAQEVQEVMPELVKEFKTEEGDRLGLDKEGIYAALVNAIKEQQSQIKELQKEIDILKNK